MVALAGGLLMPAWPAYGQDPDKPAALPAPKKMDLDTVGKLLEQLQGQVQELLVQVKELKTQQQAERSESAELRKELSAAKSQLPAGGATANVESAKQNVVEPGSSSSEERISRLEENQQLADAKLAEQSQTKVESGSKYRVRLSGLALVNVFGNRGNVDNVDFPLLAVQRDTLATGGSVGGTVRQSQIGIQGFGPTIGGARTSADLQFDFAGGFSDAPNGTSFGMMRLRTGIVRFDWQNTSLVVGQDTLFIAPLAPTSIATLATPALSYSGNLWAWTPQIRVEQKFALSESSTLLLQGGILDSLSANADSPTYYRGPSWGEASGQPGYAVRMAWSRNSGGQTFIVGAGGYYGRQAWGFGRNVDGWAGTLDAKIPLGSKFEITSQFYRGQAIGGFGAGIGQTAAWNGSLLNPLTLVYGVDSVGGWAQLKYTTTSKLQFNAALGIDNPFANELREYGGNRTYYLQPLSKNESALVNFIYQPRSDIVFSMEFRRLKTFTLDSNSNTANVSSFSLGYIF
jgi:hypothetical protein